MLCTLVTVWCKNRAFCIKGDCCVRFHAALQCPEPGIFLKNSCRELLWGIYFDLLPIRRNGRNQFLAHFDCLCFASQKCLQTKSLSMGLYSMSLKCLQIDSCPPSHFFASVLESLSLFKTYLLFICIFVFN